MQLIPKMQLIPNQHYKVSFDRGPAFQSSVNELENRVPLPYLSLKTSDPPLDSPLPILQA